MANGTHSRQNCYVINKGNLNKMVLNSFFCSKKSNIRFRGLSVISVFFVLKVKISTIFNVYLQNIPVKISKLDVILDKGIDCMSKM